MKENITVIIPSSPIKKHPSLNMIQTTIGLIRYQLPHAPIIIACDGVRKEQEDRTEDYNIYKNKLFEWAEGKNIQIIPFSEHNHQTGMIREVLPKVQTDNLLFIEHDFPVVGDIPWEDIETILNDKQADLVRFYLESDLIPEHKHLFLDETPILLGKVPVIRVGQWSQRPHIARTDFYKKIFDGLVPRGRISYIEDTIHGHFDSQFQDNGKAAWERNKLCVYYPEGDISRCLHLDGRGNETKWI